MNISGEVGVISDTHSLLRDEALEYLSGCDLILHAGDIGKITVIEQLKELAPVIAIKGNIDKGEWANQFEDIEAFEVNGRYILMLHNIAELDLDPSGEFDVVIYGHSHKPESINKHGVLFFNPGSAGPRRFKLPISLGKLRFNGDQIENEIFEIPHSK